MIFPSECAIIVTMLKKFGSVDLGCVTRSLPLAGRIITRAAMLFTLFILAFPASATVVATSDAVLWFVASGGDDSNTCQSPAEPCATINGAIGKASPGDTVNVAVGSYIQSLDSDEVVLLDKDVNLSGGWDASFTGQTGLSTIDGQESRRGMTVDSGVTSLVEGFIVQNGYGGGVLNLGTLIVQNSMISNNAGWGIRSEGSVPVVLLNTTVDQNSGFGVEIDAGTANIVNSTLSGNTGGGISVENDGLLSLYSTTVSENGYSEGSGGGILVGAGTVHLANTILAGNLAATGPDCYIMTGALISDGYNLIGDTAGCSVVPATGDLTGVSPRLAALRDNGGPTLTHELRPNSPAINAADPAGCVDHLGHPLTTDQRGFPRLDRCDIGAYERPSEPSPIQIFLPCILHTCPKLYFDAFSDPASGWPIDDNTNFQLEYLDGEYRILVKNTDWYALAGPGFKASDFIVEVDVRNFNGIEGTYGIAFGIADDLSQFYAFWISSTGNYELWKYDGSASPWTSLASGTSAGILPGTASNQVKVRRSGAEISVYANGALLTSVNDGSFTGLRHVGLTASSFSTPDVDVRFDNFSVYPLDCQPGAASLGEGIATNLSDAGFFIAGPR